MSHVDMRVTHEENTHTHTLLNGLVVFSVRSTFAIILYKFII